MTTEATLYDVLAVDIETREVRVLATAKTTRDAEAIIEMAVLRRGCDDDFYVAVETGRFKDSDTYTTEEDK